MYNAMKYGYKFEILKGYLFDKEYNFKDYVNSLFKMKSDVDNNSPLYVTAKLLLNSLYGRFGMSPETFKHKVVDLKNKDLFYKSVNVHNVIVLSNGKEWIIYKDISKKESDNICNVGS
jgi:DNA polymerase type B, organellar and viral